MALTLVLGLLSMLLVVVVTAVVTPVRLRARIRTSPQLAYQVDISGFSGIAPRIVIADSARRRQAATRLSRTPAPKVRRVAGSARGLRIASALPKLFADVIQTIEIESLELDAEFGLPDPADTGRLYGSLMPFQYGMCWSPRVSISIQPNFECACLAGEAYASLRLTAARLLLPAIRFAWRAFGPRR